jgi:hypothetical protein
MVGSQLLKVLTASQGTRHGRHWRHALGQLGGGLRRQHDRPAVLASVGDFGFDESDTSEQSEDEETYDAGDASGDYDSGDFGGDFGGGGF